MAQRPEKPKIVSLDVKILTVETGPCEMTTGRSTLGTHVTAKNAKGKKLNVHLGPAEEVRFLARQLSPGTKVRVEAFRTQAMKKGHYVAKSLEFDSRKVELRDATLRPAWAGPPRGGWSAQPGSAAGWRGGSGRPGWGRGRGWGRGWGRGRGAGYGRGPGYGRGAGWIR
jgi:hypothetical protein